jgi:hypothetical protein
MWTVWRRDMDVLGGQGGRVSSPRRGYPSDLTDAQWALIDEVLPEPSADGRREKHPRREIVNGNPVRGPVRVPVAVLAG